MKKPGRFPLSGVFFALVVVFVVVFGNEQNGPENEKALKRLCFKAFHWS